ncbi:MAG: gamma-glutamyltransferase [Chloroflexi bacterium]|nr:gamma-glutamyltransferase [Chloroflexota bacterium]
MADLTRVRDAKSDKGMATSANPLASQAGIDIMKKGGNAIDAAAAVSLALGVVAPAFSGMGGGGLMLVHIAKTGENHVIDYRETAPGLATASMYRTRSDGEVEGDENFYGVKAPGVPGNPAGLALALKKFGRLSLADVARPAVSLARNGFPVSHLMGAIFQENQDNYQRKFKAFPEGGKNLLKPDGTPYKKGETIVWKDYANTIDRVSKNGTAEFYEGFVADSLDKFMTANGGPMRKTDLLNYKPFMRKPLVGTFRDLQIVTLCPPSSGGIALIQLLKLFESLDLKKTGHNTSETIERMSKALGPVYKARDLVADPDFETVDSAKLTSAAFIKGLQGQAYGVEGARRDGSHTTHVSVMDAEGNIVSLTESLECFFGSGVVVPGTGMFLNDTMHDFDSVPGHLNSVAPGKRPKSSMTPTIFFKNGKPVLVVGSAAGPRIITAVLQVALNVFEHGMEVQDAINAPRFHFQGGKNIRMENRIPQDIQNELKRRGYGIELHPDYDLEFGGVQAILVKDGIMHGGADPRRDGGAVGL